MSTSSAEYETSVSRDGSDAEEPPQRVRYGAPQHETDAPDDPYREMFDVEEDEPPRERDLFTSFEHFSVDADDEEDDHSSTVGVGPIVGPQTA
ncbi:hypothetical protein [Halopelagius longus]|nr:hypothetical protein [Halopelagius longus]SDQ90871.1 hypothetical protein SAMN05216278_3013 [Halopelagius longus]